MRYRSFCCMTGSRWGNRAVRQASFFWPNGNPRRTDAAAAPLKRGLRIYYRRWFKGRSMPRRRRRASGPARRNRVAQLGRATGSPSRNSVSRMGHARAGPCFTGTYFFRAPIQMPNVRPHRGRRRRERSAGGMRICEAHERVRQLHRSHRSRPQRLLRTRANGCDTGSDRNIGPRCGHGHGRFRCSARFHCADAALVCGTPREVRAFYSRFAEHAAIPTTCPALSPVRERRASRPRRPCGDERSSSRRRHDDKYSLRGFRCLPTRRRV